MRSITGLLACSQFKLKTPVSRDTSLNNGRGNGCGETQTLTIQGVVHYVYLALVRKRHPPGEGLPRVVH